MHRRPVANYVTALARTATIMATKHATKIDWRKHWSARSRFRSRLDVVQMDTHEHPVAAAGRSPELLSSWVQCKNWKKKRFKPFITYSASSTAPTSSSQFGEARSNENSAASSSASGRNRYLVLHAITLKSLTICHTKKLASRCEELFPTRQRANYFQRDILQKNTVHFLLDRTCFSLHHFLAFKRRPLLADA